MKYDIVNQETGRNKQKLKLQITISTKALKLHVHPFLAYVTWGKWLKELSAQRRWKLLIWHEEKD